MNQVFSKKSLNFFGESHTYVKRNRRKKQGWANLNPELTTNLANDIEYFCRNLTDSQRLILNYLFHMSHKHKTIYPTQSTIARYANISRQQCNKVLDRLEKLGLIASCYRHMKSCYYKVSSFFDNPWVKSKLSHLFDAFRLVSYLVLTQLNIQGRKGINYIKELVSKTTNLSHQGPRIFKKEQQGAKTISSQENILEKLALNVYGSNPISPEIRKLTGLRLTKWGQIKLSAFPDEVIRYANSKYQYAKDIKNPFNWFFKVCFDYSNRNDIKQDWTWVQKLAIAYKMPEDAPMMLKEEMNPQYGPLEHPPTAKNNKAPLLKPITQKRSSNQQNIKKIPTTQQKRTLCPYEELQKVEKYRQTESWKKVERWIGKPFYPPGLKPILNTQNNTEA